jgi:hypothetical protein
MCSLLTIVMNIAFQNFTARSDSLTLTLRTRRPQWSIKGTSHRRPVVFLWVSYFHIIWLTKYDWHVSELRVWYSHLLTWNFVTVIGTPTPYTPWASPHHIHGSRLRGTAPGEERTVVGGEGCVRDGLLHHLHPPRAKLPVLRVCQRWDTFLHPFSAI